MQTARRRRLQTGEGRQNGIVGAGPRACPGYGSHATFVWAGTGTRPYGPTPRAVHASLLALALLCVAQLAPAATLRAVGVLGNSGEAGATLVRVEGMPLDHCSSGVAIDEDWTLWTSGGRGINRLSLAGKLVERFPIDAVVDSRKLAVLGGRLYFFARTGPQDVRLFELPMSNGAKAAPLDVKLPERKHTHIAYCLAPEPLDGKLVIAAQTEDEDITVFLVDPAAKAVTRAFSLSGKYPQGLAVKDGTLYVGGNFGTFVGGVTHSSVFSILAVDRTGLPAANGFAMSCMKTPATPTQFRGVLSLASGALWDAAWYGFLARFDLNGRGAPGRIVEWHHELDYPTQVLGLSDGEDDPLLIGTSMPDAVYLAVWKGVEQELQLVRRLGALPVISSLGLTEDGHVTVGTARTQLWWRWADPSWAPPRKTDIHLSVTPLFFKGEEALGIACQYHLRNKGKLPLMTTVFTRRPGGRNESRRIGSPPPMQEPVGLGVLAPPGKSAGTVYVTDAVTKKLWRNTVSIGNFHMDNAKWAPLAVEGGLTAPTDVAALLDGRLLVADAGRILVLEPKGESLSVQRTIEGFGTHVRFAVDGAWMLVSDTDRHRVVWLDWTRGEVLGQFGGLGSGPQQLWSPTFVALRGTRAVVADAGNQRVLKVLLEP